MSAIPHPGRAGLTTLARLRLLTAWNAFWALRSHSNLKIVVITVMAGGIWAGLFWGFYDGFTYLNDPSLIAFKPFLVKVIFSVFFLSLLVLLLFSNAIIAYGSLFRSREAAFLVARPLPAWHVYLYKLAETLLFSSWAFLFLALPLIVAFGLSETAPWHFYPGAVVFFSVFALIPAAVGGVVVLLVGRFLTHAPRRVLVICLLVVLALVVAWFAVVSRTFSRGMRPQGEVWVQSVLGKLSVSENPLLPSHWAGRGLLSLAAGDFAAAGRNLWLLLSNGLFFGMVGALMARRVYLRAYHRVQACSPRRGGRRAGRFYDLLDRALVGISPQMRLLIVKDVKTFVRDPVQWSQALIFFGLLGVYFLNIRNLRYDLGSSFWKNFICLMNLGATSFTLSTFTCRFIYPLLSLEGRKFWILGLLPLDRKRLLHSKFWFAFIGAFVISETLITLSDLMLSVPLAVMWRHSLTVLILCSGLSGLAVGIGALYPNLKEDNPSKIVSGFGGTLNLVLSLLFVVVVIGLAVVPYHVSQMTERISGAGVFTGFILPGLFFALAVGIAATFLPLWLGEKAFARMESI